MKIVELNCRVARMQTSWLTESVIANPMSVYPEYWEKRSSWYRTMSAGVTGVVLDDDTCGYGFIGGAKGTAAISLLDEQLRALVIGKSVFETELIQAQIYRTSVAVPLFVPSGAEQALGMPLKTDLFLNKSYRSLSR